MPWFLVTPAMEYIDPPRRIHLAVNQSGRTGFDALHGDSRFAGLLHRIRF